MIWDAAINDCTLNEDALSEELLESFSLRQTTRVSYAIVTPHKHTHTHTQSLFQRAF